MKIKTKIQDMSNFSLSKPRRPTWSKRSHPIVRMYLRKPMLQTRFNYFIVVCAILLFLLFGGFSLPMLYFLFSLVVLLNIALGTGDKIHYGREGYTWDLVRATPFSQREVFLSLWVASVWQIHETWMMFFYRLFQGVVVVGVIIFSLLLADIPIMQWIVVLVFGTLVIAFQPFADMYYSGMVGLLSASLTHDRAAGQGLAIGGVLVYWLLWFSLTGLIIMLNLNRPNLEQVMLILSIPVLLPLLLGFCFFRATQHLTL